MIDRPDIDFHDASLVNVTFDLEANSAQIGIRTYERTVLVTAIGVTDMALGREMPWGPSNSIDNLDLRQNSTDQELLVNLQSGDVFRVRAKTFSFS
jgi:hypothetical protein